MNLEEIKVGETYNVRVRVSQIHTPSNSIYCCTLAPNDKEVSIASFRITEAAAFFPINAENGTKNTEPAPKYDPCRLFRKGDKVQVKKRDGRCNGKDGEYLREAFCTVAEDETQNELVRVLHNATEYRLDPAYLELIDPVEERERYVVIHNDYEKYYEVCWKDDDEPDGRTGRTRCLTTFWYHNPPKTHTQKQAKAAAEAECDRLNAEYRKEPP